MSVDPDKTADDRARNRPSDADTSRVPHAGERGSTSARAFAPGNISGVFKIVANPDPAKAHSLGWGFTVADGVDVTVTRADNPDPSSEAHAAARPATARPTNPGGSSDGPANARHATARPTNPDESSTGHANTRVAAARPTNPDAPSEASAEARLIASRHDEAAGPTTTVVFNGTSIDFPTVLSAVGAVTPTPLTVDIRTPLPLSSGFGLSGASAYAACLAANALTNAGRSERELAMIAHIAEVQNLTGLGDVCAQRAGGCLVKVIPGDPLDALPIDIAPRPVYWRYLSPISTRDVLRDQARHQRINTAADAALETIAAMIGSGRDRLFERLLDVALGFATSSGLLADDQVKAGIAQARAAGGAASMIMLGNAVVSTVPFDGCSQTQLAGVAGHLVG